MGKHRIASELRNLFGANPTTRLTAADIANDLYARSPFANRVSAREAAFALIWDYEARGLVENRPGPRGGAGWVLTPKGAALVARYYSP